MQLINSTRLIAGYTLGLAPDGRESLVVVVKGTFQFPEDQGGPVRLHENQVPLVMADEYFGEPGFSAPKYEVDFAPRKLRCDILLNASAYAPDGRPTAKVVVGARVGSWSKTFTVIGDRTWNVGLRGVTATPPTPFERLPVSYDRAFGGADTHSNDVSQHDAFRPNPIGRGFHKVVKKEWVDGSPLPNTEETGKPVTEVNGSYRPQSFGVIGRQWEPRYGFGGTYDQRWRDEVFPFLPADFDEQYFQAAPADQQAPKPTAEQTVTLVNLTPDGRREFVLPHFQAPIHMFPRHGPREDLVADVDTIVIEPDLARVTMTWRVSRPLKRNIFEIGQVLVGGKSRGWWRAKDSGKPYYPSLGSFVRDHNPGNV
jgi:hypothetical protein